MSITFFIYFIYFKNIVFIFNKKVADLSFYYFLSIYIYYIYFKICSAMARANKGGTAFPTC